MNKPYQLRLSPSMIAVQTGNKALPYLLGKTPNVFNLGYGVWPLGKQDFPDQKKECPPEKKGPDS
jgi:hypothetical protein